MMLVRPARTNDLDEIEALAAQAGPGLTTLPHNRDKLEEKITASNEAFRATLEKPGSEYYFFLLEDLETGKIVGTSALVAAVGLEEAFYTYKVGKVVHTSPDLNVYNPIDVLYLSNDYTGASEIATLFLDPNYRGGTNGRLLSKARFMFMAQFPDRFSDKVIAEMRGYSDENGVSPFWESLGRKFFSMEFTQADAISGLGRNQFIAELMPKYPIYTRMLSNEAKECLGKVHDKTRPALRMLEKEGFRFENYVDIFDAGPTIEASTPNIKTVRDSQVFTTKVVGQVNGTEEMLLSNIEREAFRSAIQPAKIHKDHIVISQQTADLLTINPGQPIRACSL